MANPTWFDAAHYKAQKLAQLQATDSNGGWTAAKLDTVLAEAGFGGAEGAYAHFTQFGSLEHCSPNATFNAAEYLAAKLVQLQATDKLWVGKTLTDVQNALKASGLGEYQHYQLYGSKEGISPANAFDEVAYLDAKLAQLVTTDPTNWTGKTTLDVRASLQASGLTALEHYLAYGKGEGIVAPAVADDAKVTVPADFYIFGGKGGMPSAGFDLTRGTDNLTGTAGNDSFFASESNGFPTLNATDTLNGGAGEDTLYIGAGAGAENFAAASIKGIENVVAVRGNIDVSSNADVKTVSTIGAGSITAKLAQKVSLDSYTGNGSEVKFVDATGKDDAVALTMKSNDMAGLTVAGIEKLTLNVTGKNADYGVGNEPDTAIGFTAAAVQELVVTGEGSVKLDGTVGSTGTVTKLDFSANKGGVSVTMDSSNFAKEATVTGGAGNDSVTYNAANSTEKKLLTVDMGAGDDTFEVVGKVHKDATFNGGDGTDTLVLNDIAALTMTADFGKQFTNFEAVTLKGDTTFVASYFKGVSEATVVADGSSTANDNAVSISDLGTVTLTDGGNFGGTNAGYLDTIASLAIKAKAVDVTFDNGQTDRAAQGGIDLQAFNITDTTDLAIHSEGNVTAGTNLTVNRIGTLTGTTASDLKNITIDGDQDFTLGAIAGATSLKKIDAGALTGDLSVVLQATVEKVEVVGGAGDDTITTASGGYLTEIKGGEGDDTVDVRLTVAKLGAATTAGEGVKKMVIIDSFEKGDSINFHNEKDADGNDTSVQYFSTAYSKHDYVSSDGVDGTILKLCKDTTNVSASVAELKWFTDGTNAYIVYNTGTTGASVGDNDVIVKLSGVTELKDLALDEASGILSW